MKNKKTTFYIAAFIICIIAIQACKTFYFRSNYNDTNKLLHDTKTIVTKPFLKAHLKNGDVCILKDTWQVDTIQNVVSGIGTRYDFSRKQTIDGLMSIPIDSVSIFETNKKILNPEAGRIAALSILTAINVVVECICLANPKACFGSCPTFYLNENDNFHFADAEGFSNAIVPSMEYFDIDALNNKPISDSVFSMTMKNEALETHCINDVKLLAYPRSINERVYQSSINDFYLCENNYSIIKASENEGDITDLLQKEDRQERFSLADSYNLSSKEEIYVNFEHVKNSENLGLIVDFRQTMMTTYFIYSAMGFMGDEVGDIFAKIETEGDTKDKLENGIKKELGNIDIYLWNEKINDWELQNGFYETGPIAINRQILPLTNVVSSSKVKLKLVMNKGLWRIDYVALTNIKEKVKPIEISPNEILNKGKVDRTALTLINNPEKYLISMPGSEYKFNFVLPNLHTDYELFLYSKGYYLEWMREHWIKDKNLLKLREMVYYPKKYLKVEANAYKQYETTMEQEFWNSKIDTKTFSYYAN
ncbi:MAG: hypothetical protein IPG55_19285 [Saprospiraceae bacterium]|nr:hypothetical protein [Candidatus Defluviibacterium haderslevense]MBK7243017.1 hypothetical protein [Candidatus Defluviibacterium haderslevense]